MMEMEKALEKQASLGCLTIKTPSCQHNNSHYNDKIVAWPCYYFMIEIPISKKSVFILKQGPDLPIDPNIAHANIDDDIFISSSIIT